MPHRKMLQIKVMYLNDIYFVIYSFTLYTHLLYVVVVRIQYGTKMKFPDNFYCFIRVIHT